MRRKLPAWWLLDGDEHEASLFACLCMYACVVCMRVRVLCVRVCVCVNADKVCLSHTVTKVQQSRLVAGRS